MGQRAGGGPAKGQGRVDAPFCGSGAGARAQKKRGNEEPATAGGYPSAPVWFGWGLHRVAAGAPLKGVGVGGRVGLPPPPPGMY